MNWIDALHLWTIHLQASGSPETTIEMRRYHVARVGRLTMSTPATLTIETLLACFAAQTWAPNTRRAYRASLRAFYAWALDAGHVDHSPAHELPAVKVPRGRPRPAPEAAYRQALRSADERVQLAVQLAGICGLRRGEIARVRYDDVVATLDGHSLRVTGKGGHVRLVPLTPLLAQRLLARSRGWVFPSPSGGHLTPHYLGKLVSRALPDGMATHTLRHRCATVAYASTRDLRAVQEFLGHAKPETTSIYTAVPDGAVRAAMLAAAA